MYYVCYVFIVYCFLELLLLYWKRMCMDPFTCVFEIWNQVKEAIFSLKSLNSIVFHALFFKKIYCYLYPHPSKIFGLVLKLDVVRGWKGCSLHWYILYSSSRFHSLIYINVLKSPSNLEQRLTSKPSQISYLDEVINNNKFLKKIMHGIQ